MPPTHCSQATALSGALVFVLSSVLVSADWHDLSQDLLSKFTPACWRIRHWARTYLKCKWEGRKSCTLTPWTPVLKEQISTLQLLANFVALKKHPLAFQSQALRIYQSALWHEFFGHETFPNIPPCVAGKCLACMALQQVISRYIWEQKPHIFYFCRWTGPNCPVNTTSLYPNNPIDLSRV